MTTKQAGTIDEKSRKELLEKARRIEKRDPEMAEGLRDIAYGRTMSSEDVYKMLGI